MIFHVLNRANTKDRIFYGKADDAELRSQNSCAGDDPFYNDVTILLRLSVDWLTAAIAGGSTLRGDWHRHFRGPYHTTRESLRTAPQCRMT